MIRNSIVTFTCTVIVLAIFAPIALGQQQTTTPSPFLPLQVSTVPSNGDTTPYGLAFVPDGFPDSDVVSAGTLLVSNFNSSSTPGQGTTIITVNPNSGKTGLFFQGNSPIGFTNALTIAKVGLVFGGSLPTSNGSAEPGPLDVFDRNGNLLRQLTVANLLTGHGEWH